MKRELLLTLRGELLHPTKESSQIIKSSLSKIHMNKEMVAVMEQVLEGVQALDERELILISLRKLIKQIPRTLDKELIQGREEECCQYLEEIKVDQAHYDPLIWIEVELEFLRGLKQIKDQKYNKLWWSFEEAMGIFNYSKSTLYKRMAEGMPHYKKGGSIFFMPEEVNAWIKSDL